MEIVRKSFFAEYFNSILTIQEQFVKYLKI